MVNGITNGSFTRWGSMMNWHRLYLVALAALILSGTCFAQGDGKKVDRRFPFYAYLTGKPEPKMICYTPLELDPRQEANHLRLKTSSIRADLVALRPAFNGLILYGYQEASTPRIVALAKELKYKAILLGIWEIRSADEIDGVAALARQYKDDMALSVCVGNEGVTFKRYEPGDLAIAEARLRQRLPKGIPITTSEPLEGYEKSKEVRAFGDYLAPNLHPVFHQSKLSIPDAAKWAREEAAKLGRQLKKPVLLKETGYAHGGRAKCTPENQTQFWQSYLKPGHVTWQDGKTWHSYAAAFEAFDLPWKAQASGLPVEKHWGLFNVQRKPYPALEVWKKYGNVP